MKEIVRLLQNKIIPWTMQDSAQRLIVARSVMKQAALPSGVEISPCPIKGKRVIQKGRRSHANQRLFSAIWPDANLQEMVLPKISCITSGTADYLLGEYCLRCREGNFILIPPHAPHQRKGPFLQGDHVQNGSCDLLQAYAYSKGVLVWQSRSRGQQHVNEMTGNFLIPNANAVTLFNLLIEEAVDNHVNAERACQGLLCAFFSVVAREIQNGHYMTSGPEPDGPVHSTEMSFSENIREYLTANCHKPLKLKDAAAHMYLSPAQFTRRMRSETGVTFVELLTDIRIERAKELLRETDWTFAAISSMLSFRSYSYFLSLFHQGVGCTPMEFRRQILKSSHSNKKGLNSNASEQKTTF